MLLTEWESERRLISLFIATGLVEKQPAESLLLVGPWGSGKSKMLETFFHLPSCRPVSDVTLDPLKKVVSKWVRHEGARHLIITEFDRIFAHDPRTSARAVLLLCNLMSGDAGLELVGQSVDELRGVQMGILAAMTSDTFHRRKREMEESGLLSRFTVIYTERSQEEDERVSRNILECNTEDLRPTNFRRLRSTSHVEYNGWAAEKIELWMQANPQLRTDARFMSRINSMLKAAAHLNGRDVVTQQEVEHLKLFTPYFAGKHGVRIQLPGHSKGGRK